MDQNEVTDIFEKYVIANYGRVNKTIVKGEGNYIYDIEGNQILDMFPGWAVSGIGHCHPKVTEAICRQAKELLHIDNTFYIPAQGILSEMLSERGFGGKCFFCNSGAEAVEAALKVARLHTSKDKYKIITAEGSFHGRTFGAVTATAQAGKHDGFLPLVPGFEYVPFNDSDALKKTFSDEVAAVMIEPIQGEGGVNQASEEYIMTVRELCDANGAVMILDEVQTGMGRTGKWFGYQHYDIEPDIITLAKSLGGGVPIGAIMAKPGVADSMKPGTHASTYGGNPLVCSAGIGVIEAIEEGNLLENAQKMGEYARGKLEELKNRHSIIDHVRGLGLMIGIALNGPGGDIVNKCLEKNLRINCTQSTVIRFMPSMTVTADEIDKAVEIFDEVLSEAG